MKITIDKDLIKNLKYKNILKYFKTTNTVTSISTKTQINRIDEFALTQICDNKPNLYAIYLKESKQWNLKYIGQSKSCYIRQRMRNHLLKKHERTGAQLENVTKAIEEGYEVGLKTVEIYPEELRHYYEQKLIEELKPEWNKNRGSLKTNRLLTSHTL